MEKKNITFDNRLKFIRERKGVSQKELLEVLKISKSTYSNYESERFIIPLKHLIVYCDYLNISLDYVFGFTKKENYSNSRRSIGKKVAGQRLKGLRIDYNISQEGLAIKTNNKRTNISGYEIGNYLISTSYLYELCKTYHISADYLLGKTSAPKRIKI